MWGRKNIILLASGILIVVCVLITFLSNAGEKKTMLTFRDGSTYTGTTNEGKPVKGTLKFKNGDVYTGGFKDGHFEGRGTFKSHNGWLNCKIKTTSYKPGTMLKESTKANENQMV